MAQVSVSKAARLAGVSRTTIHRKLNKGELSRQNGLIDTSELIRVFGELKPEGEQKQDTVPTVQDIQAELLQQKIEFLTEKVASLEQDKAFLQEQLAGALLLEHKPTSENSEKPQQAEPDHTREKELEREIRQLERKEPLLIKAIKAWRK